MYLKRIVASGFKSFADKITIDLTDGITGIVGPNGSGKSNVVDAVRWVLGEQSVKSLRGEGNMADVIFSGSKSRNSMNVASVTLIFDNSDKYLPVDYNEVSIRRRVYKDGTNEYSINNEKCRLKDITDILLDTGIEKESFNIISQGKIEEIISSKASDRRIIFEEAARVLKYKKRKEDALRKLDRTHDNMSRVNDIIRELEARVTPLKDQRDKAIAYNEYKSELEQIEIALIATDIQKINFTYKENKNKIDTLNQELVELTTNTSSNEAALEEAKLKVSKLEIEMNVLQQELVEKTKEAEKINSQKNMLIERTKYTVEDAKLHNNMIDLKETALKLQNDIASLENEITSVKEQICQIDVEKNKLETSIQKTKDEKHKLDTNLTEYIRNKAILENNIASLKESIENNSALPYAVKNVLNHPGLNGIYNAIGNVIEVNEEYTVAISTALGAATSYVIVENEESAKQAIQYLKNNNIGRVTFFPLNIIKSKYIDASILQDIKTMNGYIGVASSLIECDKKYQNILENQLGNVLVVSDIDAANAISKKINHRYRIVTLEGELLHVGGSLTGGNVARTKNVITEKYELENALMKEKNITEKIIELENKMNEIDYKYRSIEDKLYLVSKNKMTLEETLHLKEKEIVDKNAILETTTLEINGIESLENNTISKEESELLENYYIAMNQIDEIKHKIEELTRKKTSLNEDIEQTEFTRKRENSLVTSKNKELKDLEIDVNRMDVKLDHLLKELNETYSMTYEKAISLYKLEIDEDVARNTVANLKRNIKELGTVNINAIEEYAEVSERYEFLLGQKEDLTNAENTLLEIISEMDSIMKEEFMKTFKVISENFETTFKELFKGGYAELKLTDPNNILETGIEIVASPPGKKLTSISLLSGGEKTFTAISLLFAILKSRPVPFCILDEVEAALDEANVDSFGKYLKNLQEKTQFILITHKKRTMEYVDVLYGITMQESGVSKLVSVKLEDIKI